MNNSSNILSTLQSWLTRENITLALSIFGTLGTIGTWIYSYLSNRPKLKGKLLCLDGNEKLCVIYLVISNESHLPISIDNVHLVLKDKTIQCIYYPVVVQNHEITRNGLLLLNDNVYSVSLPINIGAISSHGGFYVFASCQSDLQEVSTELNLLVSTNRGKTVQMTLSLESAHLSL